MSKNNKKKIKYCVYCGTDVGNETYCPNCGKLVIKLNGTKERKKPQIISKPTSIQKAEISRVCPGCGSLVTSTVLDQCPICNTVLEKVSETKKELIQKKPGLIFTNKKLEPEQKFILKKNQWNLREGINVFGTCMYIFIIVFFLIYFLLSSQGGGGTIEPNIQVFLISQIPEVLFGIYPLYYIYSKKHGSEKLGFLRDSKKVYISIIIGAIGALCLILFDFLYSGFINTLAEIGLDLSSLISDAALQNQIIRDADFIWVFLLIILMFVGTFSIEIVYRGVLHNTLKQKFKNRIVVIIIVALAYALLMIVLFPSPLYFFLNFIGFIIIGIIFEITNGNIYSTLITNISYNILLVVLIFI
ncbi:MAG: CPBP family glutamic-type intramembrane protease [Promethearchaeota archaeon]|jgi:membrane protease YdiL (CAAX protease family)